MKLQPTHIIFRCLAMTALVAVVACGGDGDDDDSFRLRESGTAEATQPQVNTTDSHGATQSTAAPKDITSRLEVPALKSGNTFVYHNVQYNNHTVMNYCLEFDPVKMHSRWVAFRFDGDTRGKASNVGRTEAWADDPALPSSMRVGIDYFGGDYNRGHLVASYDRQYSYDANAQTFYMSNMSPQLGNFNARYWARLEGLVQKMGRNTSPYSNFEDTLYVVKGGYIDSDLRGWLSRPNGKQMAIPGYYFMALLRVKGPANEASSYAAAGFWIKHDNYPYSNADEIPLTAFTDRNQVVTIDRLEQLTGIDFFHNLPDNIETTVEATVSTGVWLKN